MTLWQYSIQGYKLRLFTMPILVEMGFFMKKYSIYQHCTVVLAFRGVKLRICDKPPINYLL